MRVCMRALVLLAALSATSSAFAADRYNVALTRKDRNLYKVDGKPIWVQTRYCYVYGYGEEAALSADEIVFLDSSEKCDVKRVLKEVSVQSGNYKARLTYDDDNFYSTLDGMFIKTNLCLELEISEETVLHMNGYGGGTAIFLTHDRRCPVENIFSQLQI